MFEDEADYNPRLTVEVRKRLTQKVVVSNLEFIERARLLTLHVILQRLRKADEIALKDVLKHLSASEAEDFKEQLKPQKDYRYDVGKKPDAVKDYEKYLKKADLTNARAARYLNKRDFQRAEKFYRQADTEYEIALGRLEELHGIDPSIEPYFDRPLDFGFGSLLSIDCVGMPRYVGSKSRHNQVRTHTKIPVPTKIECAIDYLERYLQKYDWS